jgi:hypothetical protein
MATADLQDEQWLTPKGRATRERIVQAATKRKAASVSGSQLAHYFVGKPALIRAVIAR